MYDRGVNKLKKDMNIIDMIKTFKNLKTLS